MIRKMLLGIDTESARTGGCQEIDISLAHSWFYRLWNGVQL